MTKGLPRPSSSLFLSGGPVIGRSPTWKGNTGARSRGRVEPMRDHHTAKRLAGHMHVHHDWGNGDRRRVTTKTCPVCGAVSQTLEIAKQHLANGRCVRSRRCGPLANAYAGLRDKAQRGLQALCDASGMPHPVHADQRPGWVPPGPAVSPVTGRPYPCVPPRRFTRAWLKARLEQLRGGPLTGVRVVLWQRICDYAARHGLTRLGPLEEETDNRLYGPSQPISPSAGVGLSGAGPSLRPAGA
jgi:hypothetical protein